MQKVVAYVEEPEDAGRELLDWLGGVDEPEGVETGAEGVEDGLVTLALEGAEGAGPELVTDPLAPEEVVRQLVSATTTVRWRSNGGREWSAYGCCSR